MKKKTISFSFWGLFIELIGYVFFIGMYIWLILGFSNQFFIFPLLKILLGILVLIFIYGLVSNLFCLLSKKPALVLVLQGISVHTQGFHTYFLRWDEISSIEKKSYFMTNYLVLKSSLQSTVIKDAPWFVKPQFYLNKWYMSEYLVIPINSLSYRTAGSSKQFYETVVTWWNERQSIDVGTEETKWPEGKNEDPDPEANRKEEDASWH